MMRSAISGNRASDITVKINLMTPDKRSRPKSFVLIALHCRHPDEDSKPHTYEVPSRMKYSSVFRTKKASNR